jgi:chromosome segregation ATPase
MYMREKANEIKEGLGLMVMEEIKSLIYAVLERLDVQGASVEQLKTDMNRMHEEMVRLEQRIENWEHRLIGIERGVKEIKHEIVSMKQQQQRFDEQLVREEDWQTKIMQALALCSQEQKKELTKLMNKSVG